MQENNRPQNLQSILGHGQYLLMLCMRLRSCEPLLAHTEALGGDVEL